MRFSHWGHKHRILLLCLDFYFLRCFMNSVWLMPFILDLLYFNFIALDLHFLFSSKKQLFGRPRNLHFNSWKGNAIVILFQVRFYLIAFLQFLIKEIRLKWDNGFEYVIEGRLALRVIFLLKMVMLVFNNLVNFVDIVIIVIMDVIMKIMYCSIK